MQATGIAAQIYSAAMERLPRHFSPAQCAILANLMVAQSKHETADYTSHVFKANNNAFGYKFYGKSDWQLQAGVRSPEGNAYAAYSSPAQSAREMADWLGRRASTFANVSTPEMYALGLKNNGFYGDSFSTYLAGIKRYFTEFSGAASTSLMGVAALVLFIYFLKR